ncbi:AAA family ATPase [Virgibacillus halodenitrificans]|uniref:AAA family ATPase n=1 Tax=Virgibacillus halodenitrificans TaxID=1482 RepID=UPI00136F3B0A|nr:AAA family ATPase [Virgibacillus halodenitrificans]MYL45067.1 AAA family ATPase [Virgibacillus halodenitrificans]
MIITNANTGEKASFSLSGSKLTVGKVIIDLQEKQKSIENVIDICLDNQLQTMREGMGAWYVANIIIPSKQYSLEPTGETDEEGNQVMQEVELPVNLSRVELRLWGLPPQYFEQPNNTQGVEA